MLPTSGLFSLVLAARLGMPEVHFEVLPVHESNLNKIEDKMEDQNSVGAELSKLNDA